VKSLIALAASALLAATAAESAPRFTVVDGDTIVGGSTTYRLWGIDAPEAGQKCAKAGGGTWPCGKAAVAAMQALLERDAVECEAKGLDDYGRTLALCRIGDADIGAAMVSSGNAWAFRRYSLYYVAEENGSRARGIGVWQAPTEPPWEYRAHRWEVAKQKAPAGCPIKGNINREGERIYHAPWSPWYERTKVSPDAGERWFCSEGEAVNAGWRAPRWGE